MYICIMLYMLRLSWFIEIIALYVFLSPKFVFGKTKYYAFQQTSLVI